ELAFSDGALREVVRYASDRGFGARGLRGVVEEVLADVLFDAPDLRGKSIHVDTAWVRRRVDKLDGVGLH
ncbi:MAG TPA: ATP-dependent Clp protease ATP-binding subunit ClpX, partial [Anaeromyxobacter sp.]|nr:ATP-dependent Clp protease ATP-binding subunit ClpX [Anaeromyxobacter sp.]